VDGHPVSGPAPPTYLIVNKPRGYLTSRRDPAGRPVVIDLVGESGARLFPVGRLDRDAEGLVLLTNDGELANRLLHPRYEVERVYEVEVAGRVEPGALGRWRRGVTLSDGPAAPSAVELLDAGPRTTRLRLTFREGRKHEVKRYCQALGHVVRRLTRTRFGPLDLGNLRPGRSRRPTSQERTALERLRGQGRPPIMRRMSG
jgi:23S rRNA pseudouridine2605 synthase